MNKSKEIFQSYIETQKEHPKQKDIEVRPETPEELGKKYIHRLTQQAKHFVAERKAESEKKESRDLIKAADNPSEETENVLAEAEPNQKETEKEKSLLERIKHGLVLRRLRKEGFKDPEKALKFLEFVGENFELNQKELYSKETKRIEKRELKKRGHKIVHYIEDAEGNGKFTFEENVWSENNLKLWRELLDNSLNDPLELITKIGIEEKKPELFLLKSGSFRKLLNDPDVLRKIGIIKDLDVQISLRHLTSLAEYCDVIDVQHFGPDIINEMKKYTLLMGRDVPDYDFKLYVNIFYDARKRNLLNIAINDESNPNELGYSWSSIYRKLQMLLASGIEEEISRAKSMGVNITDVVRAGIREVNEEGPSRADMENIVPHAEDEKMVEFMRDLASFCAGNSIPLKQVQEVQNLYKLPDFWAFFEAYRQLGVVKEEPRGGFDIKKISECLSAYVQKYVHDKNINNAHGYSMDTSLEPIFSPVFDFVKKTASKNSFTLNPNKVNFLIGTYNEGRGNPVIASQEGEELMVYLNKIGIDFELLYEKAARNSDLRAIISEPGFLNILKNFSKYFNLDTRSEEDKKHGKFNNQAHLEALFSFFKNENMHEQLNTNSLLDILSRFCPKGSKLDLKKIHLLEALNGLMSKLSSRHTQAFERNFDFFFDESFFRLVETHPEIQDEIYYLSEDGLLDNKESHGFLYENLTGITGIPREDRKDYLRLISDLKKTGFSETLLGKMLRCTSEKKDDTNYREYLEKVKSDMNLLRSMSLATDNAPTRRVLIDGYLEADKEGKSEEFLETARKSIETNRKTLAAVTAFSNLADLESINLLLKAEGLPEITEIPKESSAQFQEFSEKHKIGDKGETVVRLLAARESKRLLGGGEFSWETLFENMSKELLKFNQMIESNNFDNIPSGLRASIGMEYEITTGGAIQRGFENRNFVNFKNSISEISRLAKVGKGADPLYEIATQPSDNPYLMLLEMKLLQDLEYIDFNFRSAESGGYYGAATGFHLSIGGEYGIKNGLNTYFLNNIISMSNWGGVNLEREVGSVGSIRDRCSDSTNTFLLENLPPSVELRNFSIDRWEPFERTVTTCFNAAVAIQAVERYTQFCDVSVIKQWRKNFPDSADELIKGLDKAGWIKEKDVDSAVNEIIYLWLKLQVDIANAIEDHNENFLTNETSGYVDNKTGEWIDAKESSGRNNERYFEEGMKNFVKGDPFGRRYSTLDQFFEKELMIDPDDCFRTPTVQYANALTRIGNLFLTKFSDSKGKEERGKKKTADPNVLSFLSNTRKRGEKIESRKQNDVEKSIFDRNGEPSEGYYYLQGASEQMIIHQAQKLLLKFNEDMANLLMNTSFKENLNIEDLALAA